MNAGEDAARKKLSQSAETLGKMVSAIGLPADCVAASEQADVEEIEQCFVDLKLKDGMTKPYPYVLDVGRIHNYTKLRFYRRGQLACHAGEICLLGAAVSRPDEKRPVVHVTVPNFTYYLRTPVSADVDALVARVEEWIGIANATYTNENRIFLTVEPVLGGAGGDDPSHQQQARGHAGGGGAAAGAAGCVTEGSIQLGAHPPLAWAVPDGASHSVVLLSLSSLYPQELVFSFRHSTLGHLAPAQPIRVRELTGVHGGCGSSPGGVFAVPLSQRGRVPCGTLRLSWSVAPQRYLRLMLAGEHLWRKDFVRPDPFFRIKRAAAPHRDPSSPPRRGDATPSLPSPRAGSLSPTLQRALSPPRRQRGGFSSPGNPRTGRPHDAAAKPAVRHLPSASACQPSGGGVTIYKSEGYRNTAHPGFLPVHIGVPEGYVVPADSSVHPDAICLVDYAFEVQSKHPERPGAALEALLGAGGGDTAAAGGGGLHGRGVASAAGKAESAGGRQKAEPDPAKPNGVLAQQAVGLTGSLGADGDQVVAMIQSVDENVKIRPAMNDNDTGGKVTDVDTQGSSAMRMSPELFELT
eukprot:gene6020-9245_t